MENNENFSTNNTEALSNTSPASVPHNTGRLHPLLIVTCIVLIIASLIIVAVVCGVFKKTEPNILSDSAQSTLTRENTANSPLPQPAVTSNSLNPPPPVTSHLCETCGVVANIRQVEVNDSRDNNNLVGTIGGAAAGGLLGSTIGHGKGRSAATLLGALGGGYAGNRVENNIHRRVAYVVSIRFENGHYENFTYQRVPFSIGQHVRKEHGALYVY